jgi:hypothetical protein
MTIQDRLENLESITREQIVAGQGILKVLDGLQSQIERLMRLEQLHFSMIQILAGEAHESEAIQQLSEQAKREIEELRRLYDADERGD